MQWEGQEQQGGWWLRASAEGAGVGQVMTSEPEGSCGHCENWFVLSDMEPWEALKNLTDQFLGAQP